MPVSLYKLDQYIMSKKPFIPPNYLHKNSVEQEAKVKMQKKKNEK